MASVSLASWSFTGKVQIDGIWYNITTKAQTAAVSPSEDRSYSGDITIPSTVEYEGVVCNVTAIANYAFAYCQQITSISLPNSVQSIGSWAFASCSNMSIYLSNNIKSFGGYAFTNCENLSFYITDLSAWCKIDRDYSVFNYAYHLYLNGEEITKLVIPDDIEEIAGYAFAYNIYINTVSIPSNVKTIGLYAFSHMDGLTSISLTDGLEKLKAGAFAYNEQLLVLRIPQSIKEIGSYAFGGCKELTDVYCYATSLPTTSGVTKKDQFDDCGISYATLHVPQQSLESYKRNEPWKKFGNIVALTDEELAIDATTINTNEYKQYFTTEGKLIERPQKGINIVKMSNGQTKKVFVR